jgi:hypothetical protein
MLYCINFQISNEEIIIMEWIAITQDESRTWRLHKGREKSYSLLDKLIVHALVTGPRCGMKPGDTYQEICESSTPHKVTKKLSHNEVMSGYIKSLVLRVP